MRYTRFSWRMITIHGEHSRRLFLPKLTLGNAASWPQNSKAKMASYRQANGFTKQDKSDVLGQNRHLGKKGIRMQYKQSKIIHLRPPPPEKPSSFINILNKRGCLQVFRWHGSPGTYMEIYLRSTKRFGNTKQNPMTQSRRRLFWTAEKRRSERAVGQTSVEASNIWKI